MFFTELRNGTQFKVPYALKIASEFKKGDKMLGEPMAPFFTLWELQLVQITRNYAYWGDLDGVRCLRTPLDQMIPHYN